MNTSVFQEGLRVWRLGPITVGSLFIASSLFAGDTIAPLGKAAQPAPVVVTQTQQAYSPGVADVLKMLDAKVDPQVVNAFIKASPVAYSLGADEIVALKGRGVPDEILAALIERGAEVRAQPGAPPPATYATTPAPVAPTPVAAAPYDTSGVPDYMYDYGYPGAAYGYYPYYSSYYYPWGYGSWWSWYNWWYPGFAFYAPFYCGWYGYGHHFYGDHLYAHYGHHPYGPWQSRPDGLRGTWAGRGQRPPGHTAPPYSAYRDGYARPAPSARSTMPVASSRSAMPVPSARSTMSGTSTRSAMPAPSASSRTGGFAARPGVATMPSSRPGLYGSPGAYRGSSGTVRSTGGFSSPAFARSSGSYGGFRSSGPSAGFRGGGSIGSMGGFRGGSVGGGGGFRGGGGGGFGGHGGGGGGGGRR